MIFILVFFFLILFFLFSSLAGCCFCYLSLRNIDFDLAALCKFQYQNVLGFYLFKIKLPAWALSMKRSNWIFQLNFSHGPNLSHYLPCTNHFCQLIRFFLPYIILFPLSSWYVYRYYFSSFFFTCVSVCSSSFLVFFFIFHFHVCARCHWAMTMRANGIFNIRIVIACVNDE